MSLKSHKHPCVTLALIASMPRVFEAVQDKCITKANCKKDSKSFYVRGEIWNYGNKRYLVVFSDQVQLLVSAMSPVLRRYGPKNRGRPEYFQTNSVTGSECKCVTKFPRTEDNFEMVLLSLFVHCYLIQWIIWRGLLCLLRLWSVTEELNSWHIPWAKSTYKWSGIRTGNISIWQMCCSTVYS